MRSAYARRAHSGSATGSHSRTHPSLGPSNACVVSLVATRTVSADARGAHSRGIGAEQAPSGEEFVAGPRGAGGHARLATWFNAPSGGLPNAGDNGRRLRPSSERGPTSSGLCPFVVAVAEVDRRQLVSNKLSRAPPKGNAARVNGDLARKKPRTRVGPLLSEALTENRPSPSRWCGCGKGPGCRDSVTQRP
jgi:hypothetical protein